MRRHDIKTPNPQHIANLIHRHPNFKRQIHPQPRRIRQQHGIPHFHRHMRPRQHHERHETPPPPDQKLLVHHVIQHQLRRLFDEQPRDQMHGRSRPSEEEGGISMEEGEESTDEEGVGQEGPQGVRAVSAEDEADFEGYFLKEGQDGGEDDEVHVANGSLPRL
mmetsp:Transcript_18618/g.38210  ORF Transcript_18618/g.38210 Transcript_18618/m.38210 type:complete len:163 (+) Transcript_18618:373-861(+)